VPRCYWHLGSCLEEALLRTLVSSFLNALPLPAILGTSAHRNIFSSKPVTNPVEAFPSRTPNVITLRSREHAESAKSTKPVNSF
jgi:hypothetical protein